MPDEPTPESDAARAAEALVPPDSYARCTGPATADPVDPGRSEAAWRLGIVTWEYDDDRQVYTEASPNIEQLTGYPRTRFYTEPGLWPSLLHPDDTAWAAPFASAARAALQNHEIEYRIIRADGQVRWLREVARIQLDGAGQITCVRGVLTDITDRKQAEVETRQAAREFETIFGLLRGLYFRLDRTCAIKRSSASMPGLLDDALLDIAGAPIDAMLPAPIAEAVHRGADAIAAGERSSFEEVSIGEGAERRLLEVSVFPLGDEELAAVVRDVSDRLETREADERHRNQLSALASEIEQTADRERRRLAEEIHDRVSQTLAIARMRLLAAEKAGAPPEEAASVRELVEEASREARLLTSELAPAGLYELGLSAALRALGESMEAQYGLVCHVDAPQPFQPDVDDDTRAFLFRAVRELLMNVVKHAGTDEAWVALTRDGDTLVATVRDEGSGGLLDPSAWRPGETGGFGLFSVRERAEWLGGRMQVTSAPGAGTTVAVRVPTHQREE
jgi:PAS domain S-box-containing protein